MVDLEREHIWGRETVSRITKANDSYKKGDQAAVAIISDCMKQLVEFYPKHIEKEDRHFFIPVMKYFSDLEKEAMLQEEYDFDRDLIHEQYEKRLDDLEKATPRHNKWQVSNGGLALP
jgi:hemerythrin-like domain-containing protein